MTLKDLVKDIRRYSGVTADSRQVKKNSVFVAVNGADIDGHDFVPEVLRRGAAVIVTEKSFPAAKDACFIKVADTREAIARLSAGFYGNPGHKLKVVGVTGTNGKTTVTYLIEAILKEAGKNPAVMGTINCRFNNRVFAALNTTPGPGQLQPLLARMLKEGVDYAVMEVSSHALDQKRTVGIDFYSAIFTNLTQDHLDYHKNLENYFLAKAKLFKGLAGRAFAVINRDDARSQRLIRSIKVPVVTYGIKRKSAVMAKDIGAGIKGTDLSLFLGKDKISLSTGLIGRHNVYNILAACAWAWKAGIDSARIKSAVEKFGNVPGRLERIDCKKGFSVFVDYAHTEDALKNILTALKGLVKGRVLVVFGCGGRRDKSKRPKMGKVVSRMADHAIITNDNPRTEDPMSIIQDIRRGMGSRNYCVIPERREAIRRSLALARPGDIVLVAGKGHEDYQIVGDRKLHFDDRETVRQCLNSTN